MPYKSLQQYRHNTLSCSPDGTTGLSPRYFPTYPWQRYHVLCFHMHIPWHSDLKCTWNHLTSPAGEKPLLYSPYKWAETTQEPQHIWSHLHELPDGYISRHCLHSSHWELGYFHSLYYICTNIRTAGWTHCTTSCRRWILLPQGWNSRDSSRWWADPQIHPRLNHPAELSALILLPFP